MLSKAKLDRLSKEMVEAFNSKNKPQDFFINVTV